MGLLGDTSKGILLLAVVIGVFLIFEFIAMNKIEIAMLLLIGLIIPLSLVAFEYQKNFMEFQCIQCKHDFKVSHLRLLFTKISGQRSTNSNCGLPPEMPTMRR